MHIAVKGVEGLVVISVKSPLLVIDVGLTTWCGFWLVRTGCSRPAAGVMDEAGFLTIAPEIYGNQEARWCGATGGDQFRHYSLRSREKMSFYAIER